MPLGARADRSELLDSGSLSEREVEQNLSDLARLNRLPGGTAASLRAIRALLGPHREAGILDAGAGGGDMAMAFARAGWTVAALDVNPQVLRVARETTAPEPRVEVVGGDVRALPFDDGAFDVAHCSLLLHHLDPGGAVDALRELARVARHGVVVNDLRRGLVPLAATWLGASVLGGSRVTRIDGIASARRAYTVDELDGLLATAGLTPRWRTFAWMPRLATAASRS